MKRILVLAALLASGCSGVHTMLSSPAPRVPPAPLLSEHALTTAAARA
jgi:hypothetical protein